MRISAASAAARGKPADVRSAPAQRAQVQELGRELLAGRRDRQRTAEDEPRGDPRLLALTDAEHARDRVRGARYLEPRVLPGPDDHPQVRAGRGPDIDLDRGRVAGLEVQVGGVVLDARVAPLGRAGLDRDHPELRLVGQHVVPVGTAVDGLRHVLRVPRALEPLVGPLEQQRARVAGLLDLAQHRRVDPGRCAFVMVALVAAERAAVRGAQAGRHAELGDHQRLPGVVLAELAQVARRTGWAARPRTRSAGSPGSTDTRGRRRRTRPATARSPARASRRR